jgi:Flp pilus assembly protein TadD
MTMRTHKANALAVLGLSIWIGTICHAAESQTPAHQAFNLRLGGESDSARSLLEGYLKNNETDAVAQFEYSRLMFYLMDFAAAEQAAQRATQLDQTKARYLYWLGKTATYRMVDLAHKQKTEAIPAEIQKAIKALEKSLALRPNFHVARKLIVDLYHNNPENWGGDKEKAIAHTEELERKDAGWGAAARLVVTDGNNPVERIKMYQQLLKKHPDNALLHQGLAKHYLAQRDQARAEVHLEKAIQFDPRSTELLLPLAFESGARQQDYGQAARYVQRYLDSHTDGPAGQRAYALFLLAQIEQRQGNKERAKELSSSFRQLDEHTWTSMQAPPTELFSAP